MSEERLRLVSLAVLGGALHGRRYDPDEVVTEVLIGSDPGCHLVVDHPGISPIHARVAAGLDECIVHDTRAPRGVYVNTARVEGEAPVAEGDVLWLGPPQEADSVCVQFHFEPWVEVLPSSLVTEEPAEPAPRAVPEAPAETTPEVAPTGTPEAAPETVAGASSLPEADLENVPEAALPPEPAPAGAEEGAAPEAVASSTPGGVEDDPFFVGEGGGAEFVAPPKPMPVQEMLDHEEPSPEPQEAPDLTPAPAEPLEPTPSPEALIAETVADDWAISDAASPEPEAAPASPVPSDEIFFEEEPVVEAELVEAEPLPPEATPPERTPPPAPSPPTPPVIPIELPPLEPRAPLPPKLAAPPVAAVPPPAPRVAPPPPPVFAPEPPGAPAIPAAAEPFVPEPHAEPPPPAPAGAWPAAEPPPPSPRPAPRPRPEAAPAARRPVSPGAPRPAAARRPVSVHPRRPPSRGLPGWVRPVGLGLAGLLLLVALGLGALRLFGGGVQLDRVEPARARVGQRVTLAGKGFAPEAAGNAVLFDDREARVLEASATRLVVEVPEVVAESGAEKGVGVVVRRGRRASAPVPVAVFQGPRLHGIFPGAALPGEVVRLEGAGWGVGATVRFGDVPARPSEVQPTQIVVVVPQVPGGVGTEAPVVVTIGGIDSNPAPFLVGHLPVVSRVHPATAGPGDVLAISGGGFQPDPQRNDVRVGGVAALVLSATPDALEVVVPRQGPGETSRPVEVRVPGSETVGLSTVQVPPPDDPVAFRFAAEPFAGPPARPHAVLATGLGPAFVLAASGGRTAAARAVEAAGRLNAAAQALRTTVGLTLEARGLDGSPVIGLAARPDVLLEVTEEDAAAYNEDWTGLRGRGGPVTRARLARWWEALGKDLVLLTVRGEPPQHASALAPEGRVLGQLFEAARRSGRPGVPRQVVDESRPPLRDGLRLLALRVPASVAVPSSVAAAAAAATATPPPRLQLEGTWTGSQVEQGVRQYLTVVFRGSGGTIAYEGGITLTVPLLTVEQPRRDQVRFSVQIRGGVRHHVARWDGEALAGSVSTDAAGKNVVASFDLRRR
jgi:hypothetical protein